jgi:hypothetical protein
MNVTVTIYDEGIILSAELVNTSPVQGKLVDYFQLDLVLFAQKWGSCLSHAYLQN